MARLTDITAHADRLLAVEGFEDYCPNGLQVQGREEVRTLVSGVTASAELLERAAAAGADAVLVHHGYFWRGEDPRITGMKYRRLQRLFAAGMSLIAYHLPLDAHPELGNNAQLGRRLGLSPAGRFGRGDLALHAEPESPPTPAALVGRLADALAREPLHIAARERPLRRIGWCTGGAEGYLPAAAELGLDAFISGEISESTVHIAREMDIHYYAAGHHATERYGVQALGEHLAGHFGLVHRFIDVPNPV